MQQSLKQAKNSLLAFKLMPGQSNAWEEHDEENLVAINAAIAAAEAAQPVVQPAEPVAWMISDNDDPELGVWLSEKKGNFPGCNNVPLYAHQQPASAQPVAVPDGWQLVPKEPTHAMKKAGVEIEIGDEERIVVTTFDEVRDIYCAMLSAAKPEGV